MAERTKSPSDIVLYYSGFCRGGRILSYRDSEGILSGGNFIQEGLCSGFVEWRNRLHSLYPRLPSVYVISVH